MWILRAVLVALAVLPFIEAKSMGLEDLMSALSTNSEDESQDESQESPVSNEQLLPFAKRSGLSDPQPTSSTPDNPINLATALQALQALKRQQSIQVYAPDYVQPVSAASAISQLRSARAVSNALPVYDDNTDSYRQTSKASSQYSSQPSSYSSYNTGSSQQVANSQAYPEAKSSMKDDRQGHYGHDGHGYEPAASYSRSPVDHYAHQPEPYSKVGLPIPSVSIKFDPLGILKLLLSGLPRPLFNLNGKIFLGLELGKNVGLGKGAPHRAPHSGHYGNERVITIG